MLEMRKEERYAVPEIYRNYVEFKIKKDPGEFIPMQLVNFSISGIKIRSPFGLAVNSEIECLIAIPKSLTKEASFRAKIKHCLQGEEDRTYFIGAEVVEAVDELWLTLFSKVHDFIKERIGKIY